MPITSGEKKHPGIAWSGRAARKREQVKGVC